MAKRSLPDISLLRNRVSYVPETGQLLWKARVESDFQSAGNISAETRAKQWNNRCAGKPAFSTIGANGYLVGPLGRGLVLYSHRVAFALMEGRWPTIIDHRNGDRADNRWSNLREVSDRENAMNCKVRSDSETGRSGVVPNRRKGSGFIAKIKANGRHVHLGCYSTFQEAVAAREAAEKVLGYSPRHGREP